MNLKRVLDYLVLFFIFALPWQTRYVWFWGEKNLGEFGTLSLYATEILYVVILFVFLINFFINRKTILSQSKSEWVRLLLFLAAILFFIFLQENSLQVFLARQAWSRLLMGVVIFSLIYFNDFSFKKNAGVLWITGLVQAIFGIAQFLTQKIWAFKWLGLAVQDSSILGTAVIEISSGRWLRAYGSFGWPNSLGIFLGVVFVLGLVIFAQTINSRWRLVLAGGQLIILAGLFFSFSRGAWLATFLGVLFWLIQNRKNILAERRIYFILIFGCLSLFLILAVIYRPLLLSRTDFSNRLEQKSLSDRAWQWQEWKQAMNSSERILLGVGLGNYTQAIVGCRENGIHQNCGRQPIHNIYLLALAEGGIIFCGLLFAFLFFCGRKIWQVAPGYLPVVITLVFAGVFDHWLFSLYVGMIFWWLVWGVGVKNTKL